jgi:hypothetical protein
VDQLCFERPEEALGQGIIVAIAGTTHGAGDPVSGEHGLVGSRGVLAVKIDPSVRGGYWVGDRRSRVTLVLADQLVSFG